MLSFSVVYVSSSGLGQQQCPLQPEKRYMASANAVQVEDRWKVLVKNCHAPYTNREAHINNDSEFSEMWANYTFIEHVEERMEAALRLSSLLGSNSEAPQAEMIQAKNVALKGFQFNDSTAAGGYRGRLANVYWYVAEVCCMWCRISCRHFMRVCAAAIYCSVRTL